MSERLGEGSEGVGATQSDAAQTEAIEVMRQRLKAALASSMTHTPLAADLVVRHVILDLQRKLAEAADAGENLGPVLRCLRDQRECKVDLREFTDEEGREGLAVSLRRRSNPVLDMFKRRHEISFLGGRLAWEVQEPHASHITSDVRRDGYHVSVGHEDPLQAEADFSPEAILNDR